MKKVQLKKDNTQPDPKPDTTNLWEVIKNLKNHLLELALAINQLVEGKRNSSGTFTLTASTTSTVVTNERCSTDSKVLFSPRTSNAAGAVATTYVTVANGSFTVTHANAATLDRTFSYDITG
jgi:hypothetical protein